MERNMEVNDWKRKLVIEIGFDTHLSATDKPVVIKRDIEIMSI
jgi:hypothetical protein